MTEDIIRVDAIAEAVASLTNGVLNGEVDALHAMVLHKRLENALKELKSTVADYAVDEAHDYAEKTFDAFGATITVKSGPGRWNFNHIEDWKIAKANLQEIEEVAKTAYKTRSKGLDVVNSDGVVGEPAHWMEGKDIVSIKLK